MRRLINKPKIQSFLNDKRQVLEQARNTKIRRIQQDLTRIANREMEYSKKLIEEIVPIKISWNEEAWKKLQEFIPIKIEPVEEPFDVNVDVEEKTSE